MEQKKRTWAYFLLFSVIIPLATGILLAEQLLADTPSLYLPSILKNYSPNLPTGPVCVDPPPEGPAVITCISTNTGPPGTVVTIEGRGFGYCYQNCSEWDVVGFSGGGFTKHGQIISYEDTKIVMQVPGSPFGDCSWDGHCHASIAVHIPTMYAPNYDPLYFTNFVHFTVTGLQPEPPTNPSFPVANASASVGDVIEIFAYGLSPLAANNLVSFNGATAVALTYTKIDPWPNWGKITVRIPAGATSGPIKVKRLDGLDQWSEGSGTFGVVAANVPTLTPGMEAGGLLNPCTYPDTQNACFDKSRNWVLMESWVLNGSGFSKLRHPSGISGALPLEITTPKTTLTVDAYVQSDNLLVMPGNYLSDQVNVLNILQELRVGDNITVKVKGMELTNRQIRTSAPLPLTYSRRPASQSDQLLILPALPPTFDISQGDHLCIYAEYSYSKPGPQHLLRAPGIWDGTLIFSDGRLTAKCFEMSQTGAFTVSDETTGKSTQIRVLAEGAFANVGVSSTTLAQTGVTIGFGGGRLVIPPGALPLHNGSGAYSISAFHRASTDVSADPEQFDGGHQFGVVFNPVPPELLKPITLTLPYSDTGRASPPQISLFDSGAKLYYPLDSNVDTATYKVSVTIPAGQSQIGINSIKSSSESAKSPISDHPSLGFPLVPFGLSLLGSFAVLSMSHETSWVQDVDGYFRVDYVTSDWSQSYVTRAYATEVLNALLETRWVLVEQDKWPCPTGTKTVSIRNLYLPGGFTSSGRTLSVLGGDIWIYIDSNLDLGTKEVAATTAHEFGHYLQRQLMTWHPGEIPWVDDATANWIAYHGLNGHINYGDYAQQYLDFPTIQFPKSFLWGLLSGYSMNQAYAAGAFFIWLADAGRYGPTVVRSLYQEIGKVQEIDPEAYPIFEKVTGSTIENIVRDFSFDYWAQTYDPIDHRQLPWVWRQFSDWDGVVFSDVRPPLSSRGYAAAPTDAWKATVGSREGVIRAYGLGEGQQVRVFGTTKPSDSHVGTQTLLGTLDWQHAGLKLSNFGAYPWYRLISVNTSRTNTSNVSLEVIVPHLLRLFPDNGSHAGGASIGITGYGFGPSPGKVMVGVQELTLANGGIIKWWNTGDTVDIKMPSGTVGPVQIRVITGENVSSDTATFTYY